MRHPRALAHAPVLRPTGRRHLALRLFTAVVTLLSCTVPNAAGRSLLLQKMSPPTNGQDPCNVTGEFRMPLSGRASPARAALFAMRGRACGVRLHPAHACDVRTSST